MGELWKGSLELKCTKVSKHVLVLLPRVSFGWKGMSFGIFGLLYLCLPLQIILSPLTSMDCLTDSLAFWLLFGFGQWQGEKTELGSLFSHPLPGHSFGNVCIFLLEAIGCLLCSFTSHWSSNALSFLHRFRRRGSKNFPLLSYRRHITVPCWTHNVGHSTHISSLNSHNQPFDYALCFSREP